MTPPRGESEEFNKAGERILSQRGVYGGARPAALVWLLTFSQEDADRYSFGEWSDRWEEVKRFAKDGGLGPNEAPLSNQATVRLALPHRLASPFTATRAFPGPGEQDMMKTLKADMKGSITSYVEQGWARTGEYKLDLIVKRDAARVSVISDIYPAFLYQAFQLIGELGSRIRQCRGCRRLFLAGRTDKKWCSGTCQASTWKRDNPKKTIPKKSKQKGGKRGTKR